MEERKQEENTRKRGNTYKDIREREWGSTQIDRGEEAGRVH